ncbi:hypothetical protein PENTCL1PPCAC_20480 [Pristionchus entomophagus]|uniref:Uncharacterized protein n=1 Tax=Pristionchus entomophagus TaxID=358040 RepID=A0AAV5TUY7_9BILA|nr:hypothetical protein PENTCL1PPCAC_20480 [Pristionchus entomophagus]
MFFEIKFETQLTSLIQLLENFPNSKYAMSLGFLPDTEALLAIPPMESIRIIPKVNSETFFKLLAIHKNIDFAAPGNFLDEWDDILLIMSADSCERTLQMREISKWLRNIGVTEFSSAGDVCGEFEVTNARQCLLMPARQASPSRNDPTPLPELLDSYRSI